MSDPGPQDDRAEPTRYRLGIMFTADRRWKLWAQLAIFCIVIGLSYRLENWLF